MPRRGQAAVTEEIPVTSGGHPTTRGRKERFPNGVDEEFALAQRRLREQEALHLKQLADWHSQPHGPDELPPMGATRVRVNRPDPTIPKNKDGEDIRVSGFRYKHVPDQHFNGDKTEQGGGEVMKHRTDGYVPVLVDEDGNEDPKGKPYTSDLGILMKIPTMQAAERVQQYAPEGSFSKEDYDRAIRYGTVDAINNAYRGKLRIWEEPEHGQSEERQRGFDDPAID